MHDWLTAGLPPVQFEGEEDRTDLICFPSTPQADQSEYVHEVHVGGTYVHDWVIEGETTPPSHALALLHVRL